jgi:hypothetical protein
MTSISDTTGKLDIGRVIQETFAVLGRNFATFLVLAIILTGIPTAIVYGVQGNVTANGLTAGFGTRVFSSVLGALIAALCGLILQGTIIYGTVSDLNGRRVSVADSLRVALYAFLPMLLIGIMMGLAIGVGLILFIVPGVMLAIAWCVAIPVYVVERPGIMDVFGRSAELTRGNRWRIFGLVILWVIAMLIVEMVFAVVGGLSNLATVGGFPLLTRLVVLPLIQVANSLIGATGVAALYVELRQIRDGVGPAGLAAIFD